MTPDQVNKHLSNQCWQLAAKSDLQHALEFELCTVPKSLFESPDLLHEAQKSTLADEIWKLNDEKDAELTENIQYVLD